MNALTDYIDFKALLNANPSYVETVSDGLFKYAKEAIVNNRIEEVTEDFQKIAKEFERIGNSLNLNDKVNRKTYCFGKISSLSRLMIELSETLKTNASYESLLHDYPLLKPALAVISNESEISGSKLRTELGLSASSLTNFIRRVSDYNLIIIHKVGRSNYYSLSTEGKRALALIDNNSDYSESRRLTVNLMVKMLDSIADEMRNERPNSISVLIKSSLSGLEISDKSILKNKLDVVFSSRDIHVKNKLLKASPTWSRYFINTKKSLSYPSEQDSDVYFNEDIYYEVN